MARNSASRPGLPMAVTMAVETVGEQIRLARKKRGMTMAEMADRMFVTRKTLQRLENGEPSVGFGVVASALFVLGLEADLVKLAEPSTDHVGAVIEKEAFDRKKRVRKKKTVDMDF
jgi:transcriptional regulator with XRE-family HTH domain